ncbi:MAG: DUF456 domain-containing protein [Dethiobacter sp.]|jgi:uncharacterized protein YqgC (DUF456 family)|nr:MAG: DUF456 domain-containing protein [Dethiobacter sp.]
MTGLALALAIFLFLLGLSGLFLPVLPGTILIFAGMLLYGFLTGFATLDANFFIFQGMAVVLTFVIDYAATVIGTKRYGGGKSAAWGAVVGTVLGVVLLGPFGVIIGPFLGAALGEVLTGATPNAAMRAGFGTLIGFFGGTILKLIISLAMIVWFFIRIFPS